jgi:hypothetical protein
MELFERSDVVEIRRALAQLTQEKGVPLTEGDVVVRKTTGRSGKLLYVVVALSGIERAVGNVLASVMTRLTRSPIGIWALRQEEAEQLLRNAQALR